jgi:hypothetical protein
MESLGSRIHRMDTAHVAGAIVLAALGVLALLRTSFNGISLKIGD